MRVLVTGAQGWLGRFTVAEFLRQRADVEVLGIGRAARHDGFSHRLPDGRRAPLSWKSAVPNRASSYLSCDLRDVDALRSITVSFKPSHVLHLAGAVSGSDSRSLQELNVVATKALFETLAGLGSAAQVIFASSGSIYGEPVYLPQDEEHPVVPVLDYAKSKWEAEKAALAVAKQAGIPLIIARIFNLIGPGTPSSLLPGSIALQLAAIALGRQPPKVRVGPLVSTRDYVDVRDCARALWALASLAPSSSPSVINIASGTGTPVKAIFDSLCEIARLRDGPAIEVEQLAPFSPHANVHIGAQGRLSRLGFASAFPLKQSLDDLYEWAFSAS
jgi:nucleoside-diphosphate-sugar epimerase